MRAMAEGGRIETGTLLAAPRTPDSHAGGWTCRGCHAYMIGDRTASGRCRECDKAAEVTRRA